MFFVNESNSITLHIPDCIAGFPCADAAVGSEYWLHTSIIPRRNPVDLGISRELLALKRYLSHG